MGKPSRKRFDTGASPVTFESIKNNASVICIGNQQRLQALAYEFDDDIKGYKPNPLSMTYEDIQGVEQEFQPQFLVERVSRGYEFEVNTQRETATQVWVDMVTRHSYNVPVSVVHKKRYLDTDHLNNLEVLYRYKRIPIDRLPASEILSRVHGNLSFGWLCNEIQSIGFPKSYAYALLAHKLLSFDLSQPLNDSTSLEVC